MDSANPIDYTSANMPRDKLTALSAYICFDDLDKRISYSSKRVS